MAVWTVPHALLSAAVLPPAALAPGDSGPVFATLLPDDRDFTRL